MLFMVLVMKMYIDVRYVLNLKIHLQLRTITVV